MLKDCEFEKLRRPPLDQAVLFFLKTEALHPADFTIRVDGVVRPNPELARNIAQGGNVIDDCVLKADLLRLSAIIAV